MYIVAFFSIFFFLESIGTLKINMFLKQGFETYFKINIFSLVWIESFYIFALLIQKELIHS